MPSQDDSALHVERARRIELAAPTVHDLFAFLARRKWVFLGAFVATMLIFSMAFFVREY